MSPKRRCQRQALDGKDEEDDDEELLLAAFPVDESPCCLLNAGLLRLRWPLLLLLARLKFLPPPLLTKLMSASSSSLKAAVNDADAVAVDEGFEDEEEDEMEET